MPIKTLKIHAIDCKVHSTGVDTAVLESLESAVKAAAQVGSASAAFLGPIGSAIGAALSAAGALIGPIFDLAVAIDRAGDYPDQLYLSLSNSERSNKIWPPGQAFSEIRSGQIVRPQLSRQFSDAIDINFWEYDSGSADDFLGRLSVDGTHVGGVRFQVVARPSEGAVYVVVYSVEDVVVPTSIPGALLWYKHFTWQEGTPGFSEGVQVGSGWQGFKSVFATSDGVIYGITPDGKLLWYRHVDYQTGTGGFRGPVQVGTDWQGFKSVFATSNGVIYGIKPDGKLLRYRHIDYLNTADHPQQVGVGVQVGTDWHGFTSVFATSGGVVYGIKPDGKLLRYQHLDYLNRTGNPQQIGVGVQVGTGWQGFKSVFATSSGVIYGITSDGKLLWYFHQGWQDGTGRWAGPVQVGNGWQGFKSVFASSNGILYGINP